MSDLHPTSTSVIPPTNPLEESDAATYIGMSVAFMRKRRMLGLDPPFVRVGRAVRYIPGDLDAFLSRSRVSTRSR